ncbi:hypothetical protein O9992_25575 [Vibrio lentus]|nr:hypothetical protein [Vibrio lentus]
MVFITSWGLVKWSCEGAANPDEFYVHKPMLEAGHYPVVKKTFGSKLIKTGSTQSNQEIGKQVDIIDTDTQERNEALTSNDEEIKKSC